MQKSSPLKRQLLFSHLSVAVLGLGMLVIALVTTYYLRDRVNLLANESGPLTQAAYQLLAGVRASLANLHGWANLGDHRFLNDWRSTWQDEIQPALQSLQENCPYSSKPVCDPERIVTLRALLADLQESQWWVQDIVQAPGNEPARLLYLQAAQPSSEKLHSLLNALLQQENESESDPAWKALIGRIGEIRYQFSNAQLALRESLSVDGAKYRNALMEQLHVLQSDTDQLSTDPLLTPAQQPLAELLQQELRTFTTLTGKIIRLRQSSAWNIALDNLATDTVPLANQVITLTSEIENQAKIRLEQERQAAQRASAIAVWSLMAMILAIIATAYLLSRKRAEALAQPIISLASATQLLTAGKLHEDIPIDSDNELGELTRSFNQLRISMQSAQEKLREANTLLEQRVAERTTDLATLNQVLSYQINVRNKTETALRESEARLRAMTRAIPDLVFVLDEEGRYREILAAGRSSKNTRSVKLAREIFTLPVPSPNLHQPTEGNEPLQAVVGVTPIRDRLLHEVHSAKMAEFFHDIIRRAITTQQIQVAEYELQTASGTRWFESRTAPLDVKFDTKAAAIVLCHDITKRKAGEAQLRQAQKMQAIGQLTGGIAHDFNNLLAVIMGNLELLNEELTERPDLYELAKQALKAVDRGTALTRRLLAFSRRQPLLAQPTDLNKLVLGMLELVRRTLGVTIRIHTALADDLPYILIDPDQLENALINLAINARDAMPKGGELLLETASVLIEAEDTVEPTDLQPGRYVLLTVSDTGAGMTPQILERAFEPFFTTKATGKGSGLGLSMVYGLVKQSGGHIAIDSKIDQGTKVRLYLPTTNTPVQMTSETRTAVTATCGKGETILVVEDDPQVRLFAINALRGLGYQPLPAVDATTALKTLENTPGIALLFTDIVMPGQMDGIKLAAEAQRRYPGLPVLYTSGYTEHALTDSGHQIEGVDVLLKPYRKADLGKKIRLLLG